MIAGLIAVFAAVFFCWLTMLAMNAPWTMPGLPASPSTARALSAAGVFEIAALRRKRLGFVGTGIPGAEVVTICVVSHANFGEPLPARQPAAIGCVISGKTLAPT